MESLKAIELEKFRKEIKDLRDLIHNSSIRNSDSISKYEREFIQDSISPSVVSGFFSQKEKKEEEGLIKHVGFLLFSFFFQLYLKSSF